jgi:hypothetical protein
MILHDGTQTPRSDQRCLGQLQIRHKVVLLFAAQLRCCCLVASLLCLSEERCPVIDCTTPDALGSIEHAELNVSSIPNMMLVGPNGVLRFQNIIISEIANEDQYVYSPSQVSGCLAARQVTQSSCITCALLCP